jgi:[CysO sulfur-carrier protein]-S-L-cysteine hydrolase
VSSPFRLQIPREIYEEMLSQALAERPNECCGFLAGLVEDGVGKVVRRFPLVNALANPTRYLSEPSSLCAANRDCREAGLEFLATYHSHPSSPPIPSKTDLEEHLWDGTVTIIISLMGPEPEVRGWWLSRTDYREAGWSVEEAFP